MKKYLVLTSVLALAACGGGSGGGAAVSGNNYSINVVRAGTVDGAVSGEVAESNSSVTGMVSQILRSSNGATINIGRSATNIAHNGVTYTESFDLSDVDFNFTDEGFGGIVRFNVDENKKITHFDILDDEKNLIIIDGEAYAEADNGELYVDNNGVLQTQNTGGGNISYNSDTGIYTYTSNQGPSGTYRVHNGTILEAEPYLYSQVGDDIYAVRRYERTGDDGFAFGGMITTTEHTQVPATLTYNSSGKDLELKYSDFGYFQLESQGDVDRPVSVIGGYDIKKIETLPSTETIFTGNAAASVISVLGGENTGTVYDPHNNGGVLYGDATLKFKNGSEKLTATFDDWYNVSYNNGAVTFNGNGKNIPTEYRLLSAADASGDITPHGEIEHDFRYYGDNDRSAEAVGLLQVRDCNDGSCTGDYNQHQEVRMNLSFGAK